MSTGCVGAVLPIGCKVQKQVVSVSPEVELFALTALMFSSPSIVIKARLCCGT